jgi:hypothetical protein
MPKSQSQQYSAMLSDLDTDVVGMDNSSIEMEMGSDDLNSSSSSSLLDSIRMPFKVPKEGISRYIVIFISLLAVIAVLAGIIFALLVAIWGPDQFNENMVCAFNPDECPKKKKKEKKHHPKQKHFGSASASSSFSSCGCGATHPNNEVVFPQHNMDSNWDEPYNPKHYCGLTNIGCHVPSEVSLRKSQLSDMAPMLPHRANFANSESSYSDMEAAYDDYSYGTPELVQNQHQKTCFDVLQANAVGPDAACSSDQNLMQLTMDQLGVTTSDTLNNMDVAMNDSTVTNDYCNNLLCGGSYNFQGCCAHAVNGTCVQGAQMSDGSCQTQVSQSLYEGYGTEMPNTYVISTSGPKIGATMGSCTIRPVTSSFQNTVGIF